MLCAMIGPTPSIAVSSSSLAAMIASRSSKRARERLRGGRADVVDAEPDEHAPQRPLLRAPRSPSTSSCAERSPIRSSGTSRSTRERVDVGRVLEQPGVDELAHALLAEPFDVHRAAARPVHEPLHTLRRAVDVDAVVVRLALDAHERLAALGALLRELPRLGLRRPLREHRPDDLGDHVAGAPHDHGVARAARPCARRRPRCAASPSRRSRRRRTPARAPRTAWPGRCDRCSP